MRDESGRRGQAAGPARASRPPQPGAGATTRRERWARLRRSLWQPPRATRARPRARSPAQHPLGTRRHAPPSQPSRLTHRVTLPAYPDDPALTLEADQGIGRPDLADLYLKSRHQADLRLNCLIGREAWFISRSLPHRLSRAVTTAACWLVRRSAAMTACCGPVPSGRLPGMDGRASANPVLASARRWLARVSAPRLSPPIGRGRRPQASVFGVPVRRGSGRHLRRQLTGEWCDDRTGSA
jgi:hypothetical protein